MRLEQSHTENLKAKIDAGQNVVRKNQKYIRVTAAIRRLVDNFHQREPLDYLRGTSHNIELNVYKEVLHRHFINLKPCEGSSNAAASRMVLVATIVSSFWIITISIKGSFLMWQSSFIRPWFDSYVQQSTDLRCSSVFGFVYEFQARIQHFKEVSQTD